MTGGTFAVTAADLPHFSLLTDATPDNADRFPFYDTTAGANRDCASD